MDQIEDVFVLSYDEYKELMHDKYRLDWLASPLNKIGNVQLPTECVERNMHSLRAAIDAAMEIKG